MSIDYRGYYSQEKLIGYVDGSGNLTLQHRKPDKGERIKYLAVCVENETNADANFRIGVNTPNRFYLRKAYLSVAADTPQTYDGEMVCAKDDEILQVRVSSGTEGDVITAYLFYVVERDTTDN